MAHTLAGGVQRLHVEDINALNLAENLQTLETGGLLEIGRDGTGGGTRGKKVGLRLDLCVRRRGPISLGALTRLIARGATNPRTSSSACHPGECWHRLEKVRISNCGGGARLLARSLRRTIEEVKVRATAGRMTARLATAKAERWRNMVTQQLARSGEDGVGVWVCGGLMSSRENVE